MPPKKRKSTGTATSKKQSGKKGMSIVTPEKKPVQ